MNFYNPYYYAIPTNYIQPKIGLLGRLFGKTGISIGNFINGTQKVLNIANQTIPLVKQVKPVIGNAKTMFKVMSEFKRAEKPSIQINQTTNQSNNINLKEEKTNNAIENNLGPTFFI